MHLQSVKMPQVLGLPWWSQWESGAWALREGRDEVVTRRPVTSTNSKTAESGSTHSYRSEDCRSEWFWIADIRSNTGGSTQIWYTGMPLHVFSFSRVRSWLNSTGSSAFLHWWYKMPVQICELLAKVHCELQNGWLSASSCRWETHSLSIQLLCKHLQALSGGNVCKCLLHEILLPCAFILSLPGN